MIDKARDLLKQGRWEDAIGIYETLVEADDQNLEAWLELGFANLLAGRRKRFLEIHAMFEHCMSDRALTRLGSRVKRLWAEYSRTCARFATAAALGTALVAQAGLPGCGKKEAGKADAAAEVQAEETPAPPSAADVGGEETAVEDAAGPADAPDEDLGGEEPLAKKKGANKDKKGPPIIKTRYIAIHDIDPEDL